jgi:hypothetical protein
MIKDIVVTPLRELTRRFILVQVQQPTAMTLSRVLITKWNKLS